MLITALPPPPTSVSLSRPYRGHRSKRRRRRRRKRRENWQMRHTEIEIEREQVIGAQMSKKAFAAPIGPQFVLLFGAHPMEKKTKKKKKVPFGRKWLVCVATQQLSPALALLQTKGSPVSREQQKEEASLGRLSRPLAAPRRAATSAHFRLASVRAPILADKTKPLCLSVFSKTLTVSLHLSSFADLTFVGLTFAKTMQRREDTNLHFATPRKEKPSDREDTLKVAARGRCDKLAD